MLNLTQIKSSAKQHYLYILLLSLSYSLRAKPIIIRTTSYKTTEAEHSEIIRLIPAREPSIIAIYVEKKNTGKKITHSKTWKTRLLATRNSNHLHKRSRTLYTTISADTMLIITKNVEGNDRSEQDKRVRTATTYPTAPTKRYLLYFFICRHPIPLETSIISSSSFLDMYSISPYDVTSML